MSTPSTVYFVIPLAEVTQRMINLSINPDTTRANIRTKNFFGNTPFAFLKVPIENRFNETFLDFKSYTAVEVSREDFIPTQVFGAALDNVGVFAQTLSSSGTTFFIYKNQQDRRVIRAWFELRAGVVGDTMKIDILDGSGLLLFTPTPSWYTQLGITPFEFPDAIFAANHQIKLTYSKSTNANSQFTLNLEQLRVVT